MLELFIGVSNRLSCSTCMRLATMESRTFDNSCLTVWPEWASSGIWHPEKRGVDGPVSMVGYDTLNLPLVLREGFEKWIEQYDLYAPDRPQDFDWESFDAEGFRLAQALANFTAGKFVVEYKLREVTPNG